jgi:hypothetical protein
LHIAIVSYHLISRHTQSIVLHCPTSVVEVRRVVVVVVVVVVL